MRDCMHRPDRAMGIRRKMLLPAAGPSESRLIVGLSAARPGNNAAISPIYSSEDKLNRQTEHEMRKRNDRARSFYSRSWPMFRTLVLGAAVVLICASVASAHITLESQQAPVGASYKAVLRVPHGCNGSATVALRVRIPEGFLDVKPMPKPGWKLNVMSGKYPKPISLRAAKVGEGVNEVDWSGGNLPDAYYDEFVLTGYIGDDMQAGQTMYFAVVQECEKGVNRWIEISTAAAADRGDSSEPAVALKLLPKR